VIRPDSPGLLFRTGAVLLALGLVSSWAVAQTNPTPQGKDSAKKAAKGAEKAKSPKNQPLTRDQAARRYREGLAQEKAGNHRAAHNSFLEAGEAGDGPAQKRLAEIYDRGNSAVKRDYQTALHWYEKARAQGIEVPKPLPPIKGR